MDRAQHARHLEIHHTHMTGCGPDQVDAGGMVGPGRNQETAAFLPAVAMKRFGRYKRQHSRRE